MSKSNKTVTRLVVFTDGEPDDYFAILLLMSLYRRGAAIFDSIKFVVSCWSDPQAKARLLKGVLANHGHKPEVYYGNSTNNFQDMTELSNLMSSSPVSKYTAELVYEADTILLLAPPVDLLEMYRADTNIFRGKQCAMYGSFNVRSLLDGCATAADVSGVGGVGNTVTNTTNTTDISSTATEMLSMFRSFDKVVWYETFFATGTVSSFTDAKTLTAMAVAYPEFPQLVNWWNKRIRATHEKVRQEVTDEIVAGGDVEIRVLLLQQKLRSDKLCSDIDNNPQQFVNADCGLVAFIFCGSSWLTADPCDIELGSITKITPNPQSNIFVVRHHGHDAEVRAEQIQQYRTVLGLSP